MSESHDFDALSTTVQSIYSLRGMGVSAVYIEQNIYDWMMKQCHNKESGWSDLRCNKCFDESDVECHMTKTGSIRMTFKPYGCDRIPIRVKHTGDNPWKIVCGYRKDNT